MADVPVWLRISVGVFVTILGVAIIMGEPFVIQLDLDKVPIDAPKGGLCLGGIVIVDDSLEGDLLDYYIQHEAKHTWQYGVSAVLGFPLVYVADLSFNTIKYGNWDDAYDNMFFERQAFSYQDWYWDKFIEDKELEVHF